jgi:hypothetical protein
MSVSTTRGRSGAAKKTAAPAEPTKKQVEDEIKEISKITGVE